MRNLLCVMTAVCVALVLATAAAKADEPQQDAKPAQAVQQSKAGSVEANDPRASQDPNYRWHNGQWWYWIPKQKNWVVWNGNAWTPYVAGRTRSGEVRTYSVQGQNATSGPYYGEGIQRLFGTPLSTVPNSVSDNNQIIGSYGMRGAGSKAIGHY